MVPISADFLVIHPAVQSSNTRQHFSATSMVLTGSKRSTNNLRSIDNSNDLSLHMLANWLRFVIAVWTLLQYLDTRQCRAGQNALLSIAGVVEKAHVAIQIGTVRMTETLNITFERDGITEIIIL